MFKKIKNIIILFVISILMITSMSGCWDKIEIDQRGFVNAIGVDRIKEQKQSENELIPPKKFLASYAITNLAAYYTGEGNKSLVLSGSGSSIAEVSEQLTTISGRTIFYGHAKVLILSEDVVKDPDGFKEIVDGLERIPALGRRVNVLVSTGEAKRIIEVQPEAIGLTGVYINTLINAKGRSSRFNPVTINELASSLHEFDNVILPRINLIKKEEGKEDIEISGCSVIKNYTHIGWLDEINTRAMMIINNKAKTEEISVFYKDIPIPYSVYNSKAKKRFVDDNKNEIVIDVKMEGTLSQYKIDTEDSLFDSNIIKEIEKVLNKAVEEQLKETVYKFQNEFEVDAIGIGSYISKNDPDTWEKLKGNWDEEFKNIKVSFNVDCKIRRIGMVK